MSQKSHFLTADDYSHLYCTAVWKLKILNVDVLITSSLKAVNVNEQLHGQDRNRS